jgi:hypothetical protein
MSALARCFLAVTAIAVVAGTAAGCSSGGGRDGAQAAIFETSPTSDLTLTVWEPTGIVVNFGLVLENVTGSGARLLGLSLVSPAGRSIRVTGFSAYRDDQSSMPLSRRGVLAKLCPAWYGHPTPIGRVVVPAHSFHPWYAVISMKFFRPGRYHVGVFRIAYETSGHPGWQLYYTAITVIVVPAKSNPQYAPTGGC